MKGQGRVYVTVFFEELGGELILGSLTAGAALDMNEMRERLGNGDHVERQLMALMLSEAIVGEDHKPLFDAQSIGEFMKTVSIDLVNEITAKIPKSKEVEKKLAKAAAEVLTKAAPISIPPVDFSPTALP